MREFDTRWLVVRITSQPPYPCGQSLFCRFDTPRMGGHNGEKLSLPWSETGIEFVGHPGRCLVTVLTELAKKKDNSSASPEITHKILKFYGFFLPYSKRTHRLPISCTKWTQSTPFKEIPLTQVLKLPSHQRLGLPSYLFPSASSNKKPVCISLHPSACNTTVSLLLVFTVH